MNGVALSHDLNGNRTAYNGLTTAHDSENRLVSATTASSGTTSYSYDADGRRTAKTASAAVTRFAHAGDMEIAEYDGATLSHRYVPGHSVDQRVAWVDVGAGITRYYHANRNGSVQAVVDTAGSVINPRRSAWSRNKACPVFPISSPYTTFVRDNSRQLVTIADKTLLPMNRMFIRAFRGPERWPSG